MVVLVACQCEEGCGLPHSHCEGGKQVRNTSTGYEFYMPQMHLDMNPNLPPHWEILGDVPPSIRIWVDWKAVAKAVMDGD